MTLTDTPRRLRRLAAVARRDGPLRLAAEVACRRWNRATDNRIAVFEWRPSPFSSGNTGPGSDAGALDLWMGRYDRPEDVPSRFYRAAEAEEGPAVTGRLLDEFLDAGVLWVPWLAGRPVGYQWTRRGDRVRPWHFELGPDTRLVFSVVTFRPYRGLGVAKRTMSEVCRREVPEASRAVGEAFVWNAASARTFEAVGFRRVSVRRPYAGYPD